MSDALMDVELSSCRLAAARIRGLVQQHEHWRLTETINLIASENIVSPAVREILTSDLEGRYADYPGRDLGQRRYRGNRFIVEIEEQVSDLARAVFRAPYVELRPLAGHMAGLAVIMGLCQPGDVVLELGRESGGHREAGRFVRSNLVPLEVKDVPFDAERYNVDVAGTLELIESVRPRVVILGSSNFLFPHPVAELADAVHRVGGYLAYDGSHVMGFLAAGQFQSPLDEGADLVCGSTHKTFPGPQGGIIFSRREDVMERVTPSLVPALVTNHHPARMPAMAVALLEMQAIGVEYMATVRSNAQSLGEALVREGIPCVEVDGRYSQSHCLLARVADFGSGAEVAASLEAGGIITTDTVLPPEQGTQGIRLGLQEITRRGADASTMARIARLFADVVLRRQPSSAVAAASAGVARSLVGLRFTLE